MPTDTRRVTIIHPNNGAKTVIEAPADVSMRRLLPALVNRLGLPSLAPNQEPIGYILTYRRDDREQQLDEEETFASANIENNDVLRLSSSHRLPLPPLKADSPKVLTDWGRMIPSLAAREQIAPCALLSPERQQLIDEIATAVESRLLIKILEQKSSSVRNISPHQIIVQPVFGPPVSEPTCFCDVFMMMPFGESYTAIFENHIKPKISARGFEIARADNFFTHHNIINVIWTAIVTCRFGIADCTGRNPNVLYELGIAHTLGKPVIVIAQNMDDVPFDIKGRRAIIYQDHSAGLKHLEHQLELAVSQVVRDIEKSVVG